MAAIFTHFLTHHAENLNEADQWKRLPNFTALSLRLSYFVKKVFKFADGTCLINLTSVTKSLMFFICSTKIIVRCSNCASNCTFGRVFN